MKLNKRYIDQVTQLESFESFFSEALDKKLQYSDLNELAQFVFGSLEKAVEQFLKEEELEAVLNK